MRRSAQAAWLAVGTVACGPYPGVEVIGATEEQAEMVDRVLMTWAGAAKRKPKLRNIQFRPRTPEMDPDESSRFFYDSGVMLLVPRHGDDEIPLASLPITLHHELGHAFDHSVAGTFSARPYWSPYAEEIDKYDQPEERYAETAGFGPDGLRLFPAPGEGDCEVNESADDAAVVRGDLLRPEGLDLLPPAPVTRTLRFPTGGFVTGVRRIGDDGVEFEIALLSYARRDPVVQFPDLDLPEAYTSLAGTPWADLPATGYFEEEDVPLAWAAGIGVALKQATPVGDGTTQLSHISMDRTRADHEKIDFRLTIETTVEGGELVAVHDSWCANVYSRSGYLRPFFAHTSEGVWLIHPAGEQVTMRFFPNDGVPRATERWAVADYPMTLVREQ